MVKRVKKNDQEKSPKNLKRKSNMDYNIESIKKKNRQKIIN